MLFDYFYKYFYLFLVLTIIDTKINKKKSTLLFDLTKLNTLDKTGKINENNIYKVFFSTVFRGIFSFTCFQKVHMPGKLLLSLKLPILTKYHKIMT